jgi:hypothetical protein
MKFDTVTVLVLVGCAGGLFTIFMPPPERSVPWPMQPRGLRAFVVIALFWAAAVAVYLAADERWLLLVIYLTCSLVPVWFNRRRHLEARRREQG